MLKYILQQKNIIKLKIIVSKLAGQNMCRISNCGILFEMVDFPRKNQCNQKNKQKVQIILDFY